MIHRLMHEYHQQFGLRGDYRCKYTQHTEDERAHYRRIVKVIPFVCGLRIVGVHALHSRACGSASKRVQEQL
jgi:hypothetical protein